jgi:hypothetical protein
MRQGQVTMMAMSRSYAMVYSDARPSRHLRTYYPHQSGADRSGSHGRRVTLKAVRPRAGRVLTILPAPCCIFFATLYPM